MYTKIAGVIVQEIKDITSFTKGKFPFNYPGFPIGHARKRKNHLLQLIKKVQNKLQDWKGKLLSFGGKYVLIRSVLQSIPIYLLFFHMPFKIVLSPESPP